MSESFKSQMIFQIMQTGGMHDHNQKVFESIYKTFSNVTVASATLSLNWIGFQSLYKKYNLYWRNVEFVDRRKIILIETFLIASPF